MNYSLPPYIAKQAAQPADYCLLPSPRGAQAKMFLPLPPPHTYLPHQRIVSVGLDFTGVDHFTLKGSKPDSFGNEAMAEHAKMWDSTKQHLPEAET